MRTEAEIDTKLHELKERLKATKHKTAVIILGAEIDALRWALGEEV